MEDDLKILKVKYLSNQCSDHLQIFNLSLGDQARGVQKLFKKDDLQGKMTLNDLKMEDNLKIIYQSHMVTIWYS